MSTPPSMVGPQWASYWVPAVALSFEHPAALGLPVGSLHVLQQITDGVEVGVDQVIALVLSLDKCRDGLPASSPLPMPPGGALQHCPG